MIPSLAVEEMHSSSQTNRYAQADSNAELLARHGSFCSRNPKLVGWSLVLLGIALGIAGMAHGSSIKSNAEMSIGGALTLLSSMFSLPLCCSDGGGDAPSAERGMGV